MSKVDCPIRGKAYDCVRCHFYTKQYTTEHACIAFGMMTHLNEIAANLRILVDSSEQHRETDVELIRSQMNQAATPELLRLVGMQEKEAG